MKTLSASLEAAQQGASGRPYLSAVLSDHQGVVARFRFSRVYSGAETPGPAALTVTGDGSFIRARIDPGTDTLYTQRVTSPGPSSTFSSWTSHGSVGIGTTCALVASGSTVYLFFVHLDTLRVRMKVSTDNGATYGAATTVATEASPVTHVAAAVNGSGNLLLLWSVGSDLRSARLTGSWSSPASWGKSVASITGIAVCWRADFQVSVSGTATGSNDAVVYAIVHGDGFALSAGTWGDLLAVERAVDGSGISFHAPAVEFAGNAYRLLFTEHFSGDIAGRHLQQTWLDLTWDFNNDRWREPFPIDYEPADDFGVAAAYAGGSNVLWLATADGVWYALLDAVETLDVSADVIGADLSITESDGSVRVELRNDDGRYTDHASVSRGMRLALAPGYVTSAGNETAAADWYWVEAVELISGSRPRAVLYCRNGWWFLDRWHARRQYSWVAGSATLLEELGFLLARAGLSLSTADASATLQSWQPAFTIGPGESGSSAVRRILRTLPDAIRFHQAGGEIVNLEAADSTDYAYGSGHAVLKGRYRRTGAAVNRTRILGATALAETLDYEDIAATGERSAPPVRDLNLTSNSLVEDRAAFELRDAQVHARRDEIDVFGLNCGQELYDVVEISDPQAGLVAARRRVLGLHWRLEKQDRQRYEMSLLLGEV